MKFTRKPPEAVRKGFTYFSGTFIYRFMQNRRCIRFKIFFNYCFRMFTFVHFLKGIMLKKSFLLGVFLWMQIPLFAQYANSVRFNLAGPALNLYSLQYERQLTGRLAFNNTFFYRPKSDIPFGGFIDNFTKKHGVGLTGIKFDDIFMNEAQVGVKGYSPELRYYLGKKKNKAFIGLFGMYEDFDMKVPALVGVIRGDQYFDVKLPIHFTFKTYSGGILIGKQFVWNRVGLDVVFIGPHIGSAGDFYAMGKNSNLQGLNEEEKEFVKYKIRERFGLKEKYFSMELNEDAAEIKSIRPVPYLGIRGVGVNLSYRF